MDFLHVQHSECCRIRRVGIRFTCQRKVKTNNQMKKNSLIIACIAFASLAYGEAELILNFDFESANWYTEASDKVSFGGNTESNGITLEESAIDGSGHYVQFSSNSAAWSGTITSTPSLSTENVLVSFFMNANEVPVGNNASHPDWAFQTILGGSTTAASGLKIGLGQDGCLKVGQHNRGGVGLDNTSALTLNTWHHVAVSFMKNEDASNYTITAYVDGEVYGTGTSAYALDWSSLACMNRPMLAPCVSAVELTTCNSTMFHRRKTWQALSQRNMPD